VSDIFQQPNADEYQKAYESAARQRNRLAKALDAIVEQCRDWDDPRHPSASSLVRWVEKTAKTALERQWK
jgi:hypothetical protein